MPVNASMPACNIMTSMLVCMEVRLPTAFFPSIFRLMLDTCCYVFVPFPLLFVKYSQQSMQSMPVNASMPAYNIMTSMLVCMEVLIATAFFASIFRLFLDTSCYVFVSCEQYCEQSMQSMQVTQRKRPLSATSGKLQLLLALLDFLS